MRLALSSSAQHIADGFSSRMRLCRGRLESLVSPVARICTRLIPVRRHSHSLHRPLNCSPVLPTFIDATPFSRDTPARLLRLDQLVPSPTVPPALYTLPSPLTHARPVSFARSPSSVNPEPPSASTVAAPLLAPWTLAWCCVSSCRRCN